MLPFYNCDKLTLAPHFLQISLARLGVFFVKPLSLHTDHACRHAFELIDIFEHHKLKTRFGYFPMHLFAHSPHSADVNQYYPHTDWKSKVADLLDVDEVLSRRAGPLDLSPNNYRDAKLCIFSR